MHQEAGVAFQLGHAEDMNSQKAAVKLKASQAKRGEESNNDKTIKKANQRRMKPPSLDHSMQPTFAGITAHPLGSALRSFWPALAGRWVQPEPAAPEPHAQMRVEARCELQHHELPTARMQSPRDKQAAVDTASGKETASAARIR